MILPNWKDKTVYIIGGGSSLPDQFDVPKEVQRKVKSGELTIDAYAPYLHELKIHPIIGVNAAFLLGDWVDILFFGDEIFYRNYKDKIMEFPKLVISCCRSFEGHPNEKINYYKRVMSYGISTQRETVAWNNNSGCAALSVAAQAGVNRIVLLGFDMQGVEGNHFHGEYVWMEGVKPRFDFHLRGMAKIKEHAQELGIEILNASPKSAIRQFKKVNIQEVL